MNVTDKILTFVKLGGSVITDKNREATAHCDVICRLAQEIAHSRNARPQLQLVVGHGSGSFGHVVGKRYSTHLGLPGSGGWEGYAQTGAAALRLNRIVTDGFLESAVPVVSLQPSASAQCRNGTLISLAVRPVQELLAAGMVPLVFGDVALDETLGFTIISTETIFGYLAGHLAPARILLVGIVDGVYTADPLIHPGACLIPEITSGNIAELEHVLGDSHGVDVTGGMFSKICQMHGLVKAHPGLQIQVISGVRPGLLEAALCDPERPIGTLIRD